MENNLSETVIDLDYKFIDLFCGIGGFHTALGRNGCKCVLSCDIDKHCREVYKDNYNMDPKSDIRDIKIDDIPDFNILCAGFPCQSFSHSGKQEGFEDKTRGTLFYEICRILKGKQPQFFILENVKNLYSHDKGNTWKTIYKSIIELGYLTYEKPIMASPLHFGIPQNRDRLFIIGIKNGSNTIMPKFPVNKKMPTNIYDILEDDGNISETMMKRVRLSVDQLSVLDIWEKFIQYFKKNNVKLPTFPIWTTEWDQEYNIKNLPEWKQKYIKKNREFYIEYKDFLKSWLIEARMNKKFTGSVSKLEWQSGKFQNNDSIWSLLFQYRPSGIRISRTTYSPALVAMSQIVYIGSKKRKLTPRETARLQSYPDDFKISENITQSYKQFGNSVNVDVVEKILFVLMNM